MVRAIVWATLLFFSLPFVTSAESVEVLDVNRLVADADVIILGTIRDVTDLGPVALEGRYPPGGGRLITGEISVRQVLKGTVRETFNFWSPVWEHVIPMGSLSRNTDVVMFIKRNSNGNNQFVSAYYPALRTLPGVQAQGSSTLDRVASAVAAVLHDAAAPSQNKLTAIWDLRDVSTPHAIEGLHASLRDRDRTVQLEAAAGLLKINDIEGLPLAEDALLRKSSADSMSFNNVKWALREVKDPRAIPALARIMKRGDAETRREATEALGKTKSRNALQPLGEALNDEDHEVRLNAVRSLANVTGNTQFLLSDEAFVEREARIIAEWKARLARLGVTIP